MLQHRRTGSGHTVVTDRLSRSWRSAADEVWGTWERLCSAPPTGRPSAYEQHFRTLEAERAAADELAAWRHTIGEGTGVTAQSL
jgi:hypothetical protein